MSYIARRKQVGVSGKSG